MPQQKALKTIKAIRTTTTAQPRAPLQPPDDPNMTSTETRRRRHDDTHRDDNHMRTKRQRLDPTTTHTRPPDKDHGNNANNAMDVPTTPNMAQSPRDTPRDTLNNPHNHTATVASASNKVPPQPYPPPALPTERQTKGRRTRATQDTADVKAPPPRQAARTRHRHAKPDAKLLRRRRSSTTTTPSSTTFRVGAKTSRGFPATSGCATTRPR